MSTAINSFASVLSNPILKGKTLKDGIFVLSAEFLLEKNKPAVIVGEKNLLLTSPVQYWELIEDVENTWGILVTLNSIYKVVLK